MSAILIIMCNYLSYFFSDWVSFLAYPNLFGIKGFVVVVVVLEVLFWKFYFPFECLVFSFLFNESVDV
jgi:hypothetical protein